MHMKLIVREHRKMWSYQCMICLEVGLESSSNAIIIPLKFNE
jgi:hypothetical protein